MITMINEKTGIFTQSEFAINGERYYLGAVFEPQIDFAKKSVKQAVKTINVYRLAHERFRRVPMPDEMLILNAQPRALLNKLLKGVADVYR